MSEINTKLSSSGTSWFYKDTDGIANSTVFGTGSGDTHKFIGSVNIRSGSSVVLRTVDESVISQVVEDAYILDAVYDSVGVFTENFHVISSGSAALIATPSSTTSNAASIIVNAGGASYPYLYPAGVRIYSGELPVQVSGSIYADDNIYNSLLKTTATSITASAGDAFLAISASGPTSVLLPSAEARLELTIADVSGSAGTNTITINASGSNKIQGASSLEISSNYGTVTFIAYDSTNWHIKSTN